MATSRRRTAKKNIGQNLNELESRVKRVERRPRSSIGSYSVTSDLIAPGAITLEKLDPALVQMLLDMSHNNDSTGETVEYVVSGGTDGTGLVTGIVDSVISEYNFSTTSASGKNSIYWQSTEPTGGEYADGDLWYDTSLDTDGLPKYTPYKYNGTTADWEVAALGDGAFRFLDAGKISTGILDAGIAVRVGTYPLNSAPVGKSRVEIASSFPIRQAAEGEDPETIATFSGIRVLRKTTESQTETTGFYQSLEINADTGRFRVGGSDEYLLYDSSTDKLLLSGKLITGTDENGNTTNESLFIGSDLSDGKDGIRLGPYNYWYRPASVVTGSDPIFKVGSGKADNAITVTKDGDVDVQGIVSPTGGTIKGRLSIRLADSNASDKFVIGQNLSTLSGLSGDEFDGIKLDSNNYWVLSNNAKKSYLKVGTATKNLLFDGSSGLLKLTGGDITLTGGGTFKTQDADSRIEINANGIYGYHSGNQKFYINTDDGSASFEGTTNPTGGVIKGKLTIRDVESAGGVNRILIGQNVSDNRDGIQLDPYNFWTISNTGTAAAISIGTETKRLFYNSSSNQLKLEGGDIVLTGGGTFKTSDADTRVEMNSNGVFGYAGGVKTFWIDADTGDSSFEGVVNPTGSSTIKGKFTVQGTNYALGRGVISINNAVTDGLYLNDSNYWTISRATGNPALFRIGNAARYLQWTGSQLNIVTDSISIGSEAVATQSYAASQATSAASSINVIQKLGTEVVGTIVNSLGEIYTTRKTTYNDTDAGWYLGWTNPTQTPAAGQTDNRSPAFNVGDANNYLKYNTLDGIAIKSTLNQAGTDFVSMTSSGLLFGDETVYFAMDSLGLTWSGQGGPAGPNQLSGKLIVRQVSARGAYPSGDLLQNEQPYNSIDFSLYSVASVADDWADPFSNKIISRLRFKDTPTGPTTSAGSIEILGNVSIVGNLSVSGTGGGSGGTTYTGSDGIFIDTAPSIDIIYNAGYRNAGSAGGSLPPNTGNKITYGSTLPGSGSGRTDGDVHFTL